MELDYLVKKLEEQNCIKDYAYLATGDNLDNSSKMAEYYSYTVGVPTLFFILQNKKENIIKRIEHLSNQLYINDTEDLTLEEMKDIIIKMKEEKNIGCVVIDYIQLIKHNKFKNLDKQDEIKWNLFDLSYLVSILDITIIVTSKLTESFKNMILNNRLKEIDDIIYLNEEI